MRNTLRTLALALLTVCSVGTRAQLAADVQGNSGIYPSHVNKFSLINPQAPAGTDQTAAPQRIGEPELLFQAYLPDRKEAAPATKTAPKRNLNAQNIAFKNNPKARKPAPLTPAADLKRTTTPQTRTTKAEEDGWTSLGWGSYREDILTTFWNVSNQVYSVEIQENDLTPGYYRLVNPYGAAYPYNEPGDWDDSQDWYLEIHAEDPNAVYIEAQQTGMDWGYGNISINSMAGYYLEQGNSLAAIAAAGWCGTLVDGIITFPTKGLLLNMPDYDDGWYYANLNGLFAVALPGYKIPDYALSVSYTDYCEYSNATTGGVVVTQVTMGNDISSVRMAVVPSATTEADAAEQIKNGTISYVTATAAGEVLIPWETKLTSGTYRIVAVGYDEYTDGIANRTPATASATFKYTESANESNWKSLGMATYREDYIAGLFELECLVYEVEVQENKEVPGFYRLVNPYGDAWGYAQYNDIDYAAKNWYLEIHAEDPNAVYIELQDLGVDFGYGSMGAYSYAAYYMDNGLTLADAQADGRVGTLVDGVITFPTKALLITDPDGTYYANMNGMFAVTLPTGIVDNPTYSLSVAYNGLYTNASNSVEGMIAQITAMDAELTSVRLAVVPKAEATTAAEDIQNGTISYVTATTTGNVNIPFTPNHGSYRIVAVGYKGSEAVTTTYTSVYIQNTWKDLGMATYREDFITTYNNLYGLIWFEPVTYQVEIQESELTPGLYRLVNPYGPANPYNEEYMYDDSQDWYLEIHAENPDAVYITTQESGVFLEGNARISSVAGYLMENGSTLAEVQEAGYTGFLQNGVITFPVNRLFINFPYHASGFYQANTHGKFAVALPGYNVPDVTLSVAYNSLQTNTNNEAESIVVNVSEIGDLTGVRLAVVPNYTSITATVEAIKTGNLDYITTTTTGTVTLPFTATESGIYTVIAVGAYHDNTAIVYEYAFFQYTLPATTTWTTLGTGTFRDKWMFTGTYPVEIQQDDADPTHFRLVDPYSAGLAAEGYIDKGWYNAGPSEYVEFQIREGGEILDEWVFYQPYNTGYYRPDDGDEISVVHPYSLNYDESYWSYNKVLTYQENGLPAVVQFAPWYVMLNLHYGWNNTQQNDRITIAFPDVKMPDYSLEIAYGGLNISADNVIESLNIQLVEMGDLDSVRIAVAEYGVEYTDFTTATSTGSVIFPLDQPGNYSAYAVGYYGGNVITYKYVLCPVKYESLTETWTEKYIGDYHHASWEGLFYWPEYYGEYSGTLYPQDELDLVLYQSDEDATRWKIGNWWDKTDFNFTWNQETNEVIVEAQETGYYNDEGRGMIGVIETNSLREGRYQQSSYADGVFTFNVQYYLVDGGYLTWDYNDQYDTFTITRSVGLATPQSEMSWSVAGMERALRIIGTEAEAAVYDVTGHLVYRGTARTVNLPAAGVYLVRIGAETQRAIVR